MTKAELVEALLVERFQPVPSLPYPQPVDEPVDDEVMRVRRRRVLLEAEEPEPRLSRRQASGGGG